MLDMMVAERKVDVFGFVTRIRAQRCQMVQTDVRLRVSRLLSALDNSRGAPSPHVSFSPSPQMQYVFIFQALLEHYLYGDTELEVTSLESHLAKLYSPSPSAGCGGLEAEFKVSHNEAILLLLFPPSRSPAVSAPPPLTLCPILLPYFLEADVHQDPE